MYIYINERTLNRPVDVKERLRYTLGIELDETDLCEMEDRLVQEELSPTQEVGIDNGSDKDIDSSHVERFNEAESVYSSANALHKQMASKELEHGAKRPTIAETRNI